ncbi:hypothetical protein C4K68_22700 [Pokkaliibacter plantistimulans]|uniref:PRTase associated wHTH domain-containing protein n=1 Tax=Proteobacteria bacterium 228 TaxID=2083153 RepID=A0A2S5KL44_9PROT|nr:hypothetical protein [Pokkaliibacter plantistimulans]PPC75036.1 hypothetical protein C4K68_22700 [Pokkaliibacter plantistimulans]
MAVFAETSTYLQFAEKPRGKAEPLLWPVLVYRVLYPEAKQAELNLFQRAVLGLIRAQVTQAESIAELAGLHVNLIKLLLAQGVSNGWLTDSARGLTEKGEQLLDGESVEDDHQKAGYMFQDAISGQFWPRFAEQLDLIEPEDPLQRYPVFIGERKSGKSIRPFVMAAGKSSLPALDHEALAIAYRDYRDDYRAARQLDSGQFPQFLKLSGVQRLDDTAKPARILLWAKPDNEGLELWSIDDPFVLRANAWWLQDTLRVQTEGGHERLLKHLQPLVSVPRADDQTVEQWLQAIRQQTDMQVLTEYPWAARQPDIKRHLAALLLRKNKLEQGDKNEQELDAAVMECQKLLEVLMQWLIHQYPVEIGHLPKQKNVDRELNERLLSALQLPAFSAGVISTLAGQKIGQITRACSRPSDSLKALLFAAAMGTLNHSAHPFKTLLAHELQLDRLLLLADLRNRSSHAQSRFTGREVAPLTYEETLDNIQYALGFTEFFKEWM